ncbi:MAG: hypothetical protein L6V93_22950 [Clostridiales bacterium]|nr:MAG: hypothetical protein L6V93_22950 [Clostridiales bacterium]
MSLANFDIEPGTVDYTLSTTAKTNQDIDVNITSVRRKERSGNGYAHGQ